VAQRTIPVTSTELEVANAELGRVLKKAERLLAKRFPGVTGRVSLVEGNSLYLEFFRDTLRLTNGKLGRAAVLFPIDKAAPHQRIAMADHLQPLYLELQGEGAKTVHEVRRAIEGTEEFNRRYHP